MAVSVKSVTRQSLFFAWRSYCVVNSRQDTRRGVLLLATGTSLTTVVPMSVPEPVAPPDTRVKLRTEPSARRISTGRVTAPLPRLTPDTAPELLMAPPVL